KDEYHGDAWTGSRGDICRCLQDEFVARKSPESTLTFNTAVEVINPELGEIRLTNPDGTTSEAQFDLVVASDGAGSAARRQMQASSSSFTVESMDNGNHSMMLAFDQNTDGLDPSYLYVFSPPPVMTVAGAINGVSGKSTPKWFCQVGFPGAKSFATVDEAKALLKSTLPPFTSFWKYASDAAIADFATQVCIATGKAKTCSSFHLGRTALLGDAGVPFPPIGQGVNAAMEMATVLEQTLTAHLQSQDWDAAAIPDALAAFTIKWKPEADAIRTISFEGLNLAERAKESKLKSSMQVFMHKFVGHLAMFNAKREDMSYAQALAFEQKVHARLPSWLVPATKTAPMEKLHSGRSSLQVL
ncbi:hypothetical protein As57867_021961, partial [Aphanomyces stellatus]